MSYSYHKMRHGLTRKLSAAVARGLDSVDRDDLEDVADQLYIINDIINKHGEVLYDVIEALEVERLITVLERPLFGLDGRIGG